MRLGDYPATLTKKSLLAQAYGTTDIIERHRHRYEVNNVYVPFLEKKGLIFSGKSPDGNLCEALELPTSLHPFFVAVQYHPEFLARPLTPHPLFTAFIRASINKRKKK
jgi:CTP synthase